MDHSGQFQEDFKVSRVEERTFRDPCLCIKHLTLLKIYLI